MKTRARTAMKPAHGMTLVEVLVALVVLSVGLLGVAGLQLSSLRCQLYRFPRAS